MALRLVEADDVARQVLRWLEGGYAEAITVGSIRRAKPTVKDVEIALLPPAQADLFGQTHCRPEVLATVVDEAVRRGHLRWHTANPANGNRLKRLVEPSTGVTVELWIADSRDNYGNVVAIRTGDADFSHALVTPKDWGGGLMPGGHYQQDGYLWRRETGGSVRVSCPTEEAFFAALGVPVLLPVERTLARARALAGEVYGVGQEVAG